MAKTPKPVRKLERMGAVYERNASIRVPKKTEYYGEPTKKQAKKTVSKSASRVEKQVEGIQKRAYNGSASAKKDEKIIKNGSDKQSRKMGKFPVPGPRSGFLSKAKNKKGK
jgi:uncharacterized protein with gpF-like domain